GSAEPVDRLGVIANGSESVAVRTKRRDDVGLDRIGILILVHQHRIEALPNEPAERGVFEHAAPEQQEVVVVEYVRTLLAVHVGAKELRESLGSIRAPGEASLKHVGELLL